MAFVASCGIADYQRDRAQIRCGNNVALCGISLAYQGLLWHDCGILSMIKRKEKGCVSDFQSIIVIATDATNATR